MYAPAATIACFIGIVCTHFNRIRGNAVTAIRSAKGEDWKNVHRNHYATQNDPFPWWEECLIVNRILGEDEQERMIDAHFGDRNGYSGHPGQPYASRVTVSHRMGCTVMEQRGGWDI